MYEEPITNEQLVYSFQALCVTMQKRAMVTLQGPDGKHYTGHINSIQAEDGSGRNWNVTLDNRHTIFVRAE